MENELNALKNWVVKNIKIEYLLVFSLVVISLVIRVTALPYVTGDFTTFLERWWNDIKINGIDKAYGHKLGGNADYFFPYLYLLGFTTLFEIKSLYVIKFISIIFDYLLAGLLFKFVQHLDPNNKFKAYAAGLGSLFLPTVIANGALWAQSDVIFTTFAVMSILLFMKKNHYWGTFAFAISFCFKLQAIFIFPAVILFLYKGGTRKLYNLLLIPLIYLTFTIPALLQGRDFKETLIIYGVQAGQYPNLNYNGFGISAILNGNENYRTAVYNIYNLQGDVIGTTAANNLLSTMVTFTTFGVVTLLFLTLVKYIKRLDNLLILQISLGFAFIIPYLLPRMHERYWFLADILSFVYAFINPKRWFMPVIIIMSSLIVYINYLTGDYSNTPLPLTWLSFIAIVPIYFIIKDIIEKIKIQYLVMDK